MNNDSLEDKTQVLNLMDKIAEKNLNEFCAKHGINKNEDLHEQFMRIFGAEENKAN